MSLGWLRRRRMVVGQRRCRPSQLPGGTDAGPNTHVLGSRRNATDAVEQPVAPSWPCNEPRFCLLERPAPSDPPANLQPLSRVSPWPSGGNERKGRPGGALGQIGHQICQTSQVPPIHSLLTSCASNLDPAMNSVNGLVIYHLVKRVRRCCDKVAPRSSSSTPGPFPTPKSWHVCS